MEVFETFLIVLGSYERDYKNFFTDQSEDWQIIVFCNQSHYNNLGLDL